MLVNEFILASSVTQNMFPKLSHFPQYEGMNYQAMHHNIPDVQRPHLLRKFHLFPDLARSLHQAPDSQHFTALIIQL
jgi:hypothetical protein